jgi:dihydropteroate synthase
MTVRALGPGRMANLDRELRLIEATAEEASEFLERASCLTAKITGVSLADAEAFRREIRSAGGRAVLAPRGEGSEGPVDLLATAHRAALEAVARGSGEGPGHAASVAGVLLAYLDGLQSPPAYSLDCRGTVLELGRRTRIMGILNVTPDSFYDGGRFSAADRAVARAEQMVEEGADAIDIGGESTRPAGPYGGGAEAVSVEEEIRRTAPLIQTISRRISVPLSIDTTKSEVARRALEAGASLVNDISALRFDPRMADVVASAGVPVVLMHMQGTPKTMQQNPSYEDLIGEISAFLAERRDAAHSFGIPADRVVLDPGLGFGKTTAHNYEILARLREFHGLDCPLLVGPSRKGFVGAALNLPPEERLEGTLAALAFCAAGGAHILRVHDVEAAVRALSVAEQVAVHQSG